MGVRMIDGIAIGPSIGVQLAGRGGSCKPVDQINGDVEQGSTFTHPADGVIAFTVTTMPAAGANIKVRFRHQDANNCWEFRTWGGGGDFFLIERVAGVETTRIFVDDGVVVGNRIVIVADGTTIRIYVNNVLRGTYASATNFATATAGQLNSLGAGGAISDLKTWSLDCRGMEGV